MVGGLPYDWQVEERALAVQRWMAGAFRQAATIELLTFAIIIGAGLGVPMGGWAAVHKDK